MKNKIKGSNAERELIHLLWEAGWAALRAAGSGSTPHLCPDILAGNGKRVLAIECKSVRTSRKYFPFEEIHDLIRFSKKVGAEPIVGVRFLKKPWKFFSAHSLPITTNHYVVTESSADT